MVIMALLTEKNIICRQPLLVSSLSSNLLEKCCQVKYCSLNDKTWCFAYECFEILPHEHIKLVVDRGKQDLTSNLKCLKLAPSELV